ASAWRWQPDANLSIRATQDARITAFLPCSTRDAWNRADGPRRPGRHVPAAGAGPTSGPWPPPLAAMGSPATEARSPTPAPGRMRPGTGAECHVSYPIWRACQDSRGRAGPMLRPDRPGEAPPVGDVPEPPTLVAILATR